MKYVSVVYALLLCMPSVWGMTQETPTLQNIFDKWSELEKHTQVGHRVVTESTDGNITRFDTKFRTHNYLSITTWPNNEQDVRLKNNQYIASLKKTNSAFALLSVDKIEEAEESGAMESYDINLAHSKTHTGLFFIHSINLREVLGSKGCDIGEIAVDGNVVRVEFGCTPSESESRRKLPVPFVRNCILLLDKENHYLPLEWKGEVRFFHEKEFSQAVYKIEYNAEQFPQRLPVSSNFSITIGATGQQVVIDKDYEYPLFNKSPDLDDFTLTAFGLPEPEWARRSFLSNWVLVLIIAGAVAVLVGGVIYRKSR